MDEIGEKQEKLRVEYCPPIDEPLFYAICSDYNLTKPDALDNCLKQLDAIKEVALEADIRDFDASGTGGFANLDEVPEGPGRIWSGQSETAARTPKPGISTTWQSNLVSDDPLAESQCVNEASQEVKVAELADMFPNISRHKITAQLRDCGDNFTAAIDDLLNHSFIPRSVDGFAEPEDQDQKRKDSGSQKLWQRVPPQLSKNLSPKTRNNRSSMGDAKSTANLEIIRRYAPIDLNSSSYHKSGNSGLWNQAKHTNTKALASTGGSGAAHVSNLLDLHGYTVAAAVELARQHVDSWWRGLGDRRYATGDGGPAREGYRIVTGVGRHSKNGIPRIRPAVFRALARDGWRVVDGEGEIFVTGKVRRS